MNLTPDTRVSLIIRLPDAKDFDAWQEFSATYEPFVYRFARRKGLQDADARELVQEVFLGVARAVRRWEPDTERARFRTWLFRIAKNQLLTLANRRKREHVLDTGAWDEINLDIAESNAFEAEEERDYRRAVFDWAADRVENQVQPKTWAAFKMTTIDGQDVASAGEKLGMRTGQVYVARSRVIKRLRKEIEQFESELK